MLMVIVVLLNSGRIQNKYLFPEKNTSTVTSATKPQAFNAKIVGNQNSSIIAFVRGGDVWTSSVDGENQTKITSHTPIQYTYRHYLSGNNIEAKWDENFFTQPRVSGDGKSIAYLEISKDAINKLLKWKEDVKNEAPEVKKSGGSIAFNPPGVAYDLKIYNLSSKQEISLADKLVDKSMESQSFDLYNWARDKNVLVFIWNSKINFIVESQNGSFNIVSLDKEFAPGPINEEWHGGEWDRPSGATISPDGNKAIAYYQFTTPAQGCFNTWGYKTYLLDFPNKKFTKLPFDASVTCQSDNVGWTTDNQYYIVEYRPNYEFEFSTWSADTATRRKVLGYRGQVSNASVSPDGAWLSYLVKNPDTQVTEYVFLKTGTTSGINLLGIMQEENTKKLNYGTIFTGKWDRNSHAVFVRMTRKSQEISDLIKFDPVSQEYKKILEDVSEYDIN